ncbi:MAG: RelA/SpoT domain-containing protein [bacterium]
MIKFEELSKRYSAICKKLNIIANKIKNQLVNELNDEKHVDTIYVRLKSVKSFYDKSQELDGDRPKYPYPFRDIQDIIGARVVVFYTDDVEIISERIKKIYDEYDKEIKTPEKESEFGYEGYHILYYIPQTFFENDNIVDLPNFFELQISTLYQHAWAQSIHGLEYKPKEILDKEMRKKFYYLSALSWGADKTLEEIRRNIKSEKIEKLISKN